MTILKKIALGGASLAMIATPMAPIMAAPAGAANYAPVSAYSGSGSYQEDTSNYRHRHRYRHRDRVDAGDVIAGIGILAGIAILADAASKSKKREHEERRYPQEYPQNYPQDDRNNYPSDDRSDDDYGNNNVGDAVTICSAAAEERAGDNARVEEIRSVTRDGNGWRVEGDLSGTNVRGFSCGATNGQVDFVQLNR